MTKMLRKIRRVFAVALAFAMMFSMIPGGAFTAKAEALEISIRLDGNGGLLYYRADENATEQQGSEFRFERLANLDKIGMAGPVNGTYFDGWEIIYWDDASSQEVKIRDVAPDPGLTGGYTIDTEELKGNTYNFYTFRAKWKNTSNVAISSAGGELFETGFDGSLMGPFSEICQNTVPGTVFTSVWNINIENQHVSKDNMSLEGWVLYTGKQAGPNEQGGYQLEKNNGTPVVYPDLATAFTSFTPSDGVDYVFYAKWKEEDFAEKLDGWRTPKMDPSKYYDVIWNAYPANVSGYFLPKDPVNPQKVTNTSIGNYVKIGEPVSDYLEFDFVENAENIKGWKKVCTVNTANGSEIVRLDDKLYTTDEVKNYVVTGQEFDNVNLDNVQRDDANNIPMLVFVVEWDNMYPDPPIGPDELYFDFMNYAADDTTIRVQVEDTSAVEFKQDFQGVPSVEYTPSDKSQTVKLSVLNPPESEDVNRQVILELNGSLYKMSADEKGVFSTQFTIEPQTQGTIYCSIFYSQEQYDYSHYDVDNCRRVYIWGGADKILTLNGVSVQTNNKYTQFDCESSVFFDENSTSFEVTVNDLPQCYDAWWGDENNMYSYRLENGVETYRVNDAPSDVSNSPIRILENPLTKMIQVTISENIWSISFDYYENEHVHGELQKLEAKAATCTESGLKEAFECPDCKELFADKEGEESITAEDRVIKALGHNPKVEGKKDATCTLEGYTGDEVCQRCETTLKKGAAIEKLGHSYKSTMKPATCTIDGEKTYVCETCGDTYKEILTAVGHIYQDGICSVCEEKDPEYKPETKVEAVTKPETKKVAEEVKDEIVSTISDSIKEVKATLAAGGETVSTDKLIATVKEALTESKSEEVKSVVEAVSDKTLEKVILAVEESKEIKVAIIAQPVSAEKAKEAAKADVEKIEKLAVDKGAVAQYLDLAVLIQAKSGDGKVENLGTIDEPTKEITFTLSLPADIQKEGRVFYIIRVHNDGAAEKLSVTDNEDGTISFKTDKFSTYALAYADEEEGKDTDGDEDENEDENEETKPAVIPSKTSPKTGDTNPAGAWAVIMLAGMALMGTAAYKKSKRTIQ